MAIEFNGNKQKTNIMKQVVIDEMATFGDKIETSWYCRNLKVKDVYDDNQNKTGEQVTVLELLPTVAADALIAIKQEAVLDTMVPVFATVHEVLGANADQYENKHVELVADKYRVMLKNTASVAGIDTSYKFDTFQLDVEAGGINATGK